MLPVTKMLLFILLLTPICLHLFSDFTEETSPTVHHLLLKLKASLLLTQCLSLTLTCWCLPACLRIDPHLSDQWPTECGRPLPDPAELHLCPLHQIGAPANQNAERRPHDSDAA